MKVCLFVAAAGLAACAVARPVDIGGLSAWSVVDTEVSTNVPFAFEKENARDLLVSLALAGTPSNNVQVAFGRDANANGVLDAGEEGLTVGWDCGRWVLRGGALSEGRLATNLVWTAEVVTTNRVKQLSFDLGVSRKKAKRLVASENGAAIEWNLPAKIPGALYDNSWDLLKLTVRGVDVADESLRANLIVSGTVVTIR